MNIKLSLVGNKNLNHLHINLILLVYKRFIFVLFMLISLYFVNISHIKCTHRKCENKIFNNKIYLYFSLAAKKKLYCSNTYQQFISTLLLLYPPLNVVTIFVCWNIILFTFKYTLQHYILYEAMFRTFRFISRHNSTWHHHIQSGKIRLGCLKFI